MTASTANVRKDRQAKLLVAIEEATTSGQGGGGVDHEVPALATAGDLVREELRKERARAADLATQVSALRDAGHVQVIASGVIVHGPYRDRHELAFSDSDAKFVELKALIRASGGNRVPILVRPIPGERYEVIYGHRRHRACVALDLPCNAIVQDMSDRDVVLMMSHENGGRRDLSAYEHAQRYQNWLQRGLMQSQAEIAEVEGISQGTVSRFLSINEVPSGVFARLRDPRSVTGPWAAKVVAAFKKAEGLEAKFLEDVPAQGNLTPKEVLDKLAFLAGWGARQPAVEKIVAVGGNSVFTAVTHVREDGVIQTTQIRFARPLSEAETERVAQFIEAMHGA